MKTVILAIKNHLDSKWNQNGEKNSSQKQHRTKSCARWLFIIMEHKISSIWFYTANSERRNSSSFLTDSLDEWLNKFSYVWKNDQKKRGLNEPNNQKINAMHNLSFFFAKNDDKTDEAIAKTRRRLRISMINEKNAKK